MSKKTYIQRTWHSDHQSEEELSQVMDWLRTDNQSQAIRYGLSLAAKQLEKQRETA